MNWEPLISHWENQDLIKISLSLFAGLLLGIEREVKDKAAGFKTITIICLGSTLFTILSYKMGESDSEDATRIASYVVSGIGFLGAGVIFKDGINVNGLTTASVIWIAAAIGMAFGFGEYLIGISFLICSFFVIYAGNYISKTFINKTTYRVFYASVKKENINFKHGIYEDLAPKILSIQTKQVEIDENEISYTFEITFKSEHTDAIEYLLISNPNIIHLRF